MDIEEVAPILNPETTETTTTPESEPVKLNQAQLDSLIKSKMALAGRQAREDAEKLRIENERLKQAVSGKGSEDQLEALKGELASERLRNQQVLDASIKQAKDLLIAQECSRHGFVDLDTLQRLTRANLRHNPDTGNFEPVNDDGTPVLNSNQESMSVTDFFAAYGNKRPWLQKGVVTPGMGSGGSTGSTAPARIPLEKIFGPTSDSRIANQVALGRIAGYDYAALKREAQRKELI